VSASLSSGNKYLLGCIVLFIRVSNSGRTGQPPKRDSQQHAIRYTANQKVRTAKLKPIEYSANTPKFPALTGNFGVDGRRLGESGALFRYLDLIQPEYLAVQMALSSVPSAGL
jgi:hypothetical protein